MSAQALLIQNEPDWQAIAEWASTTDFNLQQVDCLITLMLKILDGKCKMDEDTQMSARVIYAHAHRNRSHLFDPCIHDFIARVFDEPDLLSLRHVRELRVYAESVIAKPVMKGFKQFIWASLP
jgi:hypothetical protein